MVKERFELELRSFRVLYFISSHHKLILLSTGRPAKSLPNTLDPIQDILIASIGVDYTLLSNSLFGSVVTCILRNNDVGCNTIRIPF